MPQSNVVNVSNQKHTIVLTSKILLLFLKKAFLCRRGVPGHRILPFLIGVLGLNSVPAIRNNVGPLPFHLFASSLSVTLWLFLYAVRAYEHVVYVLIHFSVHNFDFYRFLKSVFFLHSMLSLIPIFIMSIK